MTTDRTYSVHTICRVCLDYVDNGGAYDLFIMPDLAKAFTVCTSLVVDAQDGYPRQLCAGCYGRLKDLKDFQQLCLSSLERFKQFMKSSVLVDLQEPELPQEEAEHQQEQAEQATLDYDPLLSHKMELIGNEEEVFKLLEHVDKHQESSSSSEDDVPLAQRLLESGPKRKKIPLAERYLRNLRCHICQQKFRKQLNYEEHMKHHNGLLPFQCQVENCKKGFTTAAALRLHVDYAHTKRDEQIPCTVEGCSLLFPRSRLLTIHLKKVHNMTRTNGQRVEQPCSECGLLFRCPAALKKHMYTHTGEQLPYPCNICGKGFHINSALKNHLLRHAGIKNYVCPYCGVGKTTRQEWNKHLLIHTQENMFKCSSCDHATHTKRALDNHVRIVHEKIKDYACQYCGKTFGKSHACKIHEMTHTGEKRCECKVCGKKFLYAESLTKHLKIHEKCVEQAIETYRQRQVELGEAPTGEAPSGEPAAADELLKVCAESVATIPKDPRRVERVDISQLAGTVLNPIPTEPVPPKPPKDGLHFCPGCNQSFNNLGNMKRHYKSVHEKVKDFACRYCTRRFANSQSLKQHEWIHTGEKPHSCRICGTHFRQEAALIRHHKVHEVKPPKPVKPPKQITEKCRQKEILKCEKRRKVEALKQQIAEAAKEELQELAHKRVLKKQQNTYKQYQAAAAAAAEVSTDEESEIRLLAL